MTAKHEGDARRAAALRWLAAGAVALGLHAGVALLLIRDARPEPLDAGGGGAFAVELDPVEGEAAKPDEVQPTVPADEASEAAAAAAAAQASRAAPQPPAETPPPVQMPAPPPPVQPPPVQPPPRVEPPSPVQPPAPPSEAAPDVPAPPPPPPPPESSPPDPRSEPPRPVTPPVEAVQPSAASAASAAADDAAPAVQKLSAARVASWRGKLVPHLNRFRRPLPGGAGGTARIGFTIDGEGRVTATSVKASSGDAALDAAARELVQRASPFPSPPPGVTGAGLSFVVPVHYDGRRS